VKSHESNRNGGATTRHQDGDNNQTNLKLAGTDGRLQDDVSKEKSTSRCRYRPSGILDLSFHSEGLLGNSRSVMTIAPTRKSVDTVGVDRRLSGRAFARCLKNTTKPAPTRVVDEETRLDHTTRPP
jgi:hypothetical protein